jgi:hypothetical protein
MTQEDLVLQLHEERMSVVEIHTGLVEIFSLLALAYSSVTRIARSASWTDNSSMRPGRPANEQFDEFILNALEKDPIAFVRRIANMTKIAPAPVFYFLTNRLRFVSRKYRFVPHVVTATLREDRLVR